MIRLPIPLSGISQEAIFDKCVSGFSSKRSQGIITRLNGIRQTVIDDSKEYRKGPQEFKETHSLPNYPEPAKDDLVNLYDKKFAAKRSPGRMFYDKIKYSSMHDRCALCGVGTVSTLDHYLPKSKYPTLSVTPSNLVPSCAICNNAKKEESDRLLVHAYFDRIPNDEPWLFAEIVSSDPIAVNYNVSCPKHWDKDLAQRICNQFEILDLGSLYSMRASEEIANHMDSYLTIYRESGKELLEKILESNIRTADRDSKYWLAALYRALKQYFASRLN